MIDLSKPWGGLPVTIGEPITDLNGKATPFPPLRHIGRGRLDELTQAFLVASAERSFADFIVSVAAFVMLSKDKAVSEATRQKYDLTPQALGQGFRVPVDLRAEAARWFDCSPPAGHTLALACSEHLRFLSNELSFRLTWDQRGLEPLVPASKAMENQPIYEHVDPPPKMPGLLSPEEALKADTRFPRCPLCGQHQVSISEHVFFYRDCLGFNCPKCGPYEVTDQGYKSLREELDAMEERSRKAEPVILVGGPLNHCRTKGTGRQRIALPVGQGTYHRTEFTDNDDRLIYVHESLLPKEEGRARWAQGRAEKLIAMANAAPATVKRSLADEDQGALEKVLGDMMAESKKFYEKKVAELKPEPAPEPKEETWLDRAKREPML